MSNLELFQSKVDEKSAWLIPHQDMFQGEYIAKRDDILAWVSGFDGSAGLGIVTNSQAALAVDSRYTLQAKTQGQGVWEVIDFSSESLKKFLLTYNKKLQVVYFDPWLFSVKQAEFYKNIIDSAGLKFKACKQNIVDTLWQGRPEKIKQNWQDHTLEFSGKSSIDKIYNICEKIKKLKLHNYLITAVDNISWLLNVRGNLVPYTPVVQAFALLNVSGKVTVFSGDNTKPDALNEDISWHSMYELTSRLESISDKVGFDPATTPLALAELLQVGVNITDPITLTKACKNKVETAGMRAAHQRDGRTLSCFISWLNENYQDMDEWLVGEKLTDVRSQQKHYRGDSFSTIAGFKANGAIVHYRAEEETALKLSEGPLLLDSGAQYLDGTTDVTRTIWLGNSLPSDDFKKLFTLVLKGHIALAMAIFPKGTTGKQLDAFARQFLWNQGLDYGHGTGHGVGSFLSVHEGPQGISPKSANVALQPGMVVSNEPGYYLEGQFGIRHENLVLVSDHPKYDGFLYFETLTCVPFDERCIDTDMLTPIELKWLHAYHYHVEQVLID